MNTDDILKERGKTHGDYATQAGVTQNFKAIIRGHADWAHLSFSQRESLDMIAHKLARICIGDPNHKDHWDDIAGYARLVSKELEKAAGKEG